MKTFSALVIFICLIVVSCHPRVKRAEDDEEHHLNYFYYPTPDEEIQIVFNDTTSLLSASLKPNIKTVFLVDGFTAPRYTPFTVETKDTYSVRTDMNIIIVDYSVHSGSGRPIEDWDHAFEVYMDVLLNEVPKAASELADFINFICTTGGIRYSDIVIIGHSMGGHTAGTTGRAVISKYNQTIGRIIGLDPSLQLSELDAPMRLRRGDANIVEIYTTERTFAGDIYHAVGDLRVFVNGGAYQPCEAKFLGQPNPIDILCDDHGFSWKLYNYLAGNDTIKACPCKGAACVCYECGFECGEDGISIGVHIPEDARGTYHVKTGTVPW